MGTTSRTRYVGRAYKIQRTFLPNTARHGQERAHGHAGQEHRDCGHIPGQRMSVHASVHSPGACSLKRRAQTLTRLSKLPCVLLCRDVRACVRTREGAKSGAREPWRRTAGPRQTEGSLWGRAPSSASPGMRGPCEREKRETRENKVHQREGAEPLGCP